MNSPTSYDIVPYWGDPYRESHPDQLASVARLFGLSSPTVDGCRVLELGCSSGANLIPMAVSLPEATFLGIDLSQRQIDEGRRTIAALGLRNIELVHGSIDTIGPGSGLFDYIVCHGVYSWVSRAIQDHILQVCSQNLAADGVAYVSYNTHPGWFMRGMVRRMMRFHARRFSDPATQLEQARALLDFLFHSSSGGDEAFHALLSRELNILKNCKDSYIFHEHLEEINEPLFFYEFVERAQSAGLRYLAEPHLNEMIAVSAPPEITQVLGKLGGDIVKFEQYLDFLKNRMFRRTLLCHVEKVPDREITPPRLCNFRITSLLSRKGASGGLLIGAEEWEFTNGAQAVVKVGSPIHKAALTVLEEASPGDLSCDDLERAAQVLLGANGVSDLAQPVDRFAIADFILPLYLQGLLEIGVAPPRFSTSVPALPLASPLARFQAERGQIVTNLRHERVQLGALDHELLKNLDGSRDRRTLAGLLEEAVACGRLTITSKSGPLEAEARTPQLVAEILEQGLTGLARLALLVR